MKEKLLEKLAEMEQLKHNLHQQALEMADENNLDMSSRYFSEALGMRVVIENIREIIEHG